MTPDLVANTDGVTLSLGEFALVLPALLLVEGFFSGSEIAIISADRVRLRSRAQGGSRSAALALSLAEHPERVFSTTLVVTNVCIAAISVLAMLFAISRTSSGASGLAVGIATPLILIFGELLPKTLFRRAADRLAPVASYGIVGAYYLLFPLTYLISNYSARIARAVARVEELVGGRQRNFRDELKSLISAGKSETKIKSSERRMLKRIFDFKDTEAKHALIPLVRVDAVEESTPVDQVLERFREHRHSRMPVFRERIDHIVGLIEVTDLFRAQDLKAPIRNYRSPIRFVAETHALDDLMDEMKREDEKLVVVVDEYGGAVGILTLEDILEEIVGEIDDEYDSTAAPLYRELAPDSLSVSARAPIVTLNEQFRLDLPEGDYETLGGFLLQQFGRIPEVGDELYFDTQAGTLKFTIRKANERRIETVQLDKIVVPAPTASNESEG